ncbi:Protein PBDC1 [Schistosoma japonicum]|nr:Protein PBDC1 [Schistosoma japonicum]KAH8875540.1 Protein PBDC1 [Schistosoma japonicum]
MTWYDAEKCVNHPDIEMQWAEHCVRHAEAYFRLLCSVSDPSELRLTAVDEVIFDKFLEMFGDIPLDVISEDSLKSEQSKAVSLSYYFFYQLSTHMVITNSIFTQILCPIY